MNIFEPFDSVSLSIDCAKKYNNITFDGCYYYFTVQGSLEIIQTDCKFHILKCLSTCREYDCICYDITEHCFWASSKKQSNAVYKLNCHMCEIDCITVDGGGQTIGDITGLSNNCCNDTLFIAYANCILEMNKHCQTAILRYKSQYMQITNVLCICPGLIITGIKNCEQYVYLLDDQGAVIHSYPMPCDILIRNIIFNPCVSDDAGACLDFFVLKKGCYPYLHRYCLHMDALPFIPCQCNFDICCNAGCEDDDEADACAAVLNSIALVEASLAHILNAEGEKLQKVLAECHDMEMILAVNREVNKTIINATQLEYNLFLKLSVLMEHCGEDHSHKNSCTDCVHPHKNPCVTCGSNQSDTAPCSTIQQGHFPNGCRDSCFSCDRADVHSCEKDDIQRCNPNLCAED